MTAEPAWVSPSKPEALTPGGPRSAPRSSHALEVMFSDVGSFRVAVVAGQVRTITDATASSAVSIDLADKLGGGSSPSAGAASPALGSRPRRILHLGTSRGSLSVMVGEDVWPGTLDRDALQEPPALVLPELHAAGIGHLFLDDQNRFGYVLDPEAL